MKHIYYKGKWATIFEEGDFGDGSCMGSLMMIMYALFLISQQVWEYFLFTKV